jgi:hypothetical protein
MPYCHSAERHYASAVSRHLHVTFTDFNHSISSSPPAAPRDGAPTRCTMMRAALGTAAFVLNSAMQAFVSDVALQQRRLRGSACAEAYGMTSTAAKEIAASKQRWQRQRGLNAQKRRRVD